MRLPCTVDDCDRLRAGRGLCLMHYKRRRKAGEDVVAHAEMILARYAELALT